MGRSASEQHPAVVDSLRRVAAALGISQSTVQNWVREGLPREGRGRGARYDLVQVTLWAAARGKVANPYQAPRRPGRPRAGESPDDDLDAGGSVLERRAAAELRKVTLQCEQLEHALEDIRGSHVPMSDVERMFADRAMTLRTAMLQIPGALAPELVNVDAHEAKRVLSSRLRAILEAFAKNNWREMLEQWAERAKKGLKPRKRGRRRG